MAPMRAKATPEVRDAKNILYRRAYRRVKRAIKAGFYIEAIAITESMICDRLESMLAVKNLEPVNLSTITRLMNKLENLKEFDADIKESLRTWNIDRGRAIHQMVKVTSEESDSWRERIAFAHEVAERGVKIEKNLQKVATRFTRSRRIKAPK